MNAITDDVPKTKDEILERLEKLLWLHFPDDPGAHGPSWDRESCRSDFFAAFKDSQGQVTRYDLNQYVYVHWYIQREHSLPTSERFQLRSLIDAWGEWEYARRKLSEE